jgi:hypothetical protein
MKNQNWKRNKRPPNLLRFCLNVTYFMHRVQKSFTCQLFISCQIIHLFSYYIIHIFSWNVGQFWIYMDLKLMFGRDFLQPSSPALRLPNLLYSGYQISLLGVRQLGHGVDHPPKSSTKVTERASYASAVPLRLHAPF